MGKKIGLDHCKDSPWERAIRRSALCKIGELAHNGMRLGATGNIVNRHKPAERGPAPIGGYQT
ncbi:hypothetical protein ACE1BS_23890, partial [Aeromonas jandaei]